jgi:hypothetical protein
MATSSEEVLLIVKKVRQKKQDGALYLMAERIAWAPEGKDRFTISHMYADIKCKSTILISNVYVYHMLVILYFLLGSACAC